MHTRHAQPPRSEGPQTVPVDFSKAMLSTLESFENASPLSLHRDQQAGASGFSKAPG